MQFKTRDGHLLDAYLTLPAGTSKQRTAPLIVLPMAAHTCATAGDSMAKRNFCESRVRGVAAELPRVDGL